MKPDPHASECNAKKRQDRRFTVSWPVDFSLFSSANIPEQSAVAINLSREGLCLKTDSLLKTGMNLCIRIQEFNCATECKAEKCLARMLSIAEVKWCRQINDQKQTWCLAGIKYLMGDY